MGATRGRRFGRAAGVGFGTQFEVVPELLPQVAECGAKVDVSWLRCAGYACSVYPLQ